MYEFLRLQFVMGKVDKGQLGKFVGVWLTDEEYNKILKGEAEDENS